MKPADRDRIEDFLMGRLNDEELKKFIRQMETDTELAQEVKIQQALLEQINELGHLKMRKKLAAIKKEALQPAVQSPIASTHPIRRRLPFLLAAVAAIALLLIIALNYFSPAPSTPAGWYAQHYEAYTIPFGKRSEGANPVLNTAGNLYSSGNFEEALPILESIVAASPDSDDRFELALGISQMETKQFQKAIQTFDQMIKENNNLYQNQARWYAALSHLQLQQIPKAETILQTLANDPTNYFYKNSKKLLQQIKQN